MLSVRPRATSRRLVPLVLFVTTATVTGCTPGATSSGEDDDSSAAEAPAATVTIPPVRLTPFCQAMIDLADRLEEDPPDDVEAEIIATYEQIEDEVPAEIRDDFDAVLADLRGEAPPLPPSTTDDVTTDVPPVATSTDPSDGAPPGDPFFDEGYEPADDPAVRLGAYVDLVCRDVANNPGPPPTQPLSEPTTTDG